MFTTTASNQLVADRRAALRQAAASRRTARFARLGSRNRRRDA